MATSEMTTEEKTPKEKFTDTIKKFEETLNNTKVVDIKWPPIGLSDSEKSFITYGMENCWKSIYSLPN